MNMKFYILFFTLLSSLMFPACSDNEDNKEESSFDITLMAGTWRYYYDDTHYKELYFYHEEGNPNQYLMKYQEKKVNKNIDSATGSSNVNKYGKGYISYDTHINGVAVYDEEIDIQIIKLTSDELIFKYNNDKTATLKKINSEK